MWTATKLCNFADHSISGITIDKNGIIYFTTSGQNIYQVRREPQILVTIENSSLRGIVWNEDDNKLFICDKYAIWAYSLDTRQYTQLVSVKISFSVGIAVSKDHLYVGGYICLVKVRICDGLVTTIADSSGFRDKGVYGCPFGIAVTDDDTIYAADKFCHCIRKIKDGVPTIIAGSSIERGNQDGPLDQGQLNSPIAVVLDRNNNLIVGELRRGLRILDLKRQMISTVEELSELHIECMAKSKTNEIIAATEDGTITRLVYTQWKWKRWVWLGHLKENPNDCLLAILPRDVIKEIAKSL